ncbi:MAG TPA: hypothetical protein VJV05_14270 [Pyrinomonadaceae bacterium]|nr:hypothetical protein [Pyrinomonadaceae bacterium]
MSSQNLNEIWQVDVGGQVYEAPFGELGVWIGEGSLHPEDKVRKGNLRWIEARRVPSLVPFFNAKAQGLPMPVTFTTAEAEADVPADVPVVSDSAAVMNATPSDFASSNFHTSPETAPPPPSFGDPVEHTIAVPGDTPALQADRSLCALHADVPSTYVCDGCGHGFCKACPKAYGGSVRICPLCGAMCRTLTEVTQKRSATEFRTTSIDKGFGAADFFNALGHPFKFKASLFFGALMFAGFSVGQSVSSLGGVYMMVSALFCWMLANMLSFGVLANTVDSFAHGDVEANFMPSFEDFDLWDDVVHPLFLSIGAYLSAFGPFILVMIIGTYLVISSVSSEMNTFQQDVEKIPGTHYYDAQRTLGQSEEVKGVVGDLSEKQERRLAEMEEMASGETEEAAGADEPVEDQSARETREQEELWASVQEGRKQSLESVIGKSPETQAKEKEAFVQSFLGLAAPLVVIGGIFLLWGLFYFPVACAIAGYTRSFGATLNPIVGLDTIKRLGGTYVSILVMGFVLMIAYLIVAGLAAAILSPFDLPGFGNIPAKFIGGIVFFYLWTVFSCVLGYAMFKKSDNLQLRN